MWGLLTERPALFALGRGALAPGVEHEGLKAVVLSVCSSKMVQEGHCWLSQAREVMGEVCG